MKIQTNLFSLVLMLLVAAGCSSAKSTATAAGSTSSQANAPSSRSTGNESASASAMGRTSSKKADSKTYQRTHADLVKEAEERQEANTKRREKEAKLAEKPQYSDPSYFGHKKKPKKRAVGKRKLCKECGIVH